jgi:hypothetical protein
MKTNSLVPGIAAQRGMVLHVVLVALVALMLLSITLFRSVDSSAAMLGNISLKSDANHRAHLALDQVVAWLNNSGKYTDYVLGGKSLGDDSYSANMLQADDQGLPGLLKDVEEFGKTYKGKLASTDGSGTTVYYLIERMCTKESAFTEVRAYCVDLTPQAEQAGSDPSGIAPLPRVPLRVTVRVEGPKNTLSFAQAIVFSETNI